MLSSELFDRMLTSDLVDDPERSAAVEPVRARMTATRRRRWGEQAWLAAVALGAASAFLAVSRATTWKRGNALDRDAMKHIGRLRGPAGNVVARALTFLGAVPGAAGITIAAMALARRRPRLAWQIAAGAIGGGAAEVVIKPFFRRARPTLLAHLERVQSTAFPSGHSMASASLYLTLAFVASRNARMRRHRASMLAGGGAVASLIGSTRVYLGVHWPTDVLGGLTIGTAWACLAEAAFNLTAADELDRACAATPASLGR